MHIILRLVLLAGLGLCVGCGGGITEVRSDVVQIPPADIIKVAVEGLARTGEELGSGEESLRATIEELGKTDSAKAAALLEELNKVTKARDAGARKAAAKSMLSKL
jgi:hypothetical protein